MPYIVFLVIVLFYFFLFFTRGYVLDGNHDRRESIVPFHIISLRSFKNLEVPQWNPYIFCGTKFLSSGINGFFYPPNWIAYLFPEKHLPVLLTILLILHIFAGEFFAFRFFKELLKDKYWALLSSIAYLFSTSSIMNMTQGSNIFSSFVYFPLLLYLIYTYKKRPLLSNFIYQTIGISLLLLGGLLQISLYILGFCLLFTLFSPTDSSNFPFSKSEQNNLIKLVKIGLVKLKLTGFFIINIIMGIMLSSVRFLPFYFGIKDSPQTTTSYSNLINYCLTTKSDLLRFFVPEFFGNSLNRPFLGSINHFETFSCYVGIAVAFFSLYAFIFIWKKKTLFWKLIIVLVILVILGTPLTFINYLITARSFLLFNRLAWLVPICLASLFGFLGEVIGKEKKHLIGLICFSFFLFLTLLFCLFLVYKRFPQSGKIANAKIIKFSLIYFISFYFIVMIWLFSLLKWGIKNKFVKGGLLLIITVDLLIIGHIEANNSNPFLSPPPFFPASEKERKLSKIFIENQRNWRILGMSKGTRDDICINLGIYNTSGYDNITPFYLSRLLNYPRKGDRIRNRKLKPASLRAMQLTSTLYLVFDDRIGRIPYSLPRVKLFNKYLVLSKDREILHKLLLDPHFDFLNTVILNEPPLLNIQNNHSPGIAKIIQESNNQIEVEVKANTNCLLLLNDTYIEGWHAYIDGKPVKIKRGNYAFKVVEVPKGIHKINFSFVHKGFPLGTKITLSSLGMLLIIGIVNIVKRRQKKTKEEKQKNG